MPRVIPKFYCHSKFFNPFAVKNFIFRDKKFECKSEKSQLYLYLFIYGLNKNWARSVISTETPEGVLPLPKRDFQRIIFQIHKFGGCYTSTAYSNMLNTASQEIYKDTVGTDRDNNRLQFCLVKTAIWDGYITQYIFSKYPDLLGFLQKKYKEIKIFY